MIEIGDFKIEWVDQDHIMVARNCGGGTFHTAKICVGDMESFLDIIFLSAEMTTYQNGIRIVKTCKETVDDGFGDCAF